jgi:hypothetical protein
MVIPNHSSSTHYQHFSSLLLTFISVLTFYLPADDSSLFLSKGERNIFVLTIQPSYLTL